MKRREILASFGGIISLAGCLEEQRNGGENESTTTPKEQTPTTNQKETTTESDPSEEYDYLISSLEDLRLLEKYRSVKFGLTNDIDASETANWNDGKGFKPIEGRFNGILDGRGYTINGLRIDRTIFDEENWAGTIGLIESTGEDAIIRNLGLEKIDIVGGLRVGSIVGDNGGIIENAYSTGKVTVVDKDEYEYDHRGKIAGGLVGSSSGRIIDSNSTAEIVGTREVGGLVGTNGGEIKNSFYEGSVVGNESVGGLVGLHGNNDQFSVFSSYSKGTVEGEENVGGLIGTNRGGASDCYSHSEVRGSTHVGGLVGDAKKDVRSSYSTGKVEGETPVGGLIGSADAPHGGRHSFWDVDTSGQSSSWGEAERGKPTELMQSIETYPDDYWDITTKQDFIDETWYIIDGDSYPKLGFQHPDKLN